MTEGTRLGGYTLTRRLATGGMGVLWLAVTQDGSAVAVKVLRTPLERQAHFRSRFAREVEALARLTGPHTPRLLAADPDAPTPYLAMEYVSGPTIEQRLKTAGALELDELLSLATGLAHALAAVHGAGMVHRDLKPNNVILAERGPVVIDFGIVQPTQAEPITSTDVVMGSPGWTAPELMSGQRATSAADIFGWAGVVAYAATGRNPYGSGPTFEVLDRVRYSEPDLAHVPAPIAPLLRSAMAADPAQRPDAERLLGALSEVAERERRRQARARRAAPVRVAALAVGVALVGGLAAGGGLAASGIAF